MFSLTRKPQWKCVGGLSLALAGYTLIQLGRKSGSVPEDSDDSFDKTLLIDAKVIPASVINVN